MKRFFLGFFLAACVALTISCRTSRSLDLNDASWSLTLEKGGCLDVCKSYSITIKEDGTYSYVGKMNVKHLGSKQGGLDTKVNREIEEQIQTIDWQALDEVYGKPSEDAPRNQINCSINGETYTIVYYQMEPQNIRQLELLIDSLIDDENF